AGEGGQGGIAAARDPHGIPSFNCVHKVTHARAPYCCCIVVSRRFIRTVHTMGRTQKSIITACCSMIFTVVTCFNVDTKFATIFQDPEGQPGSYFGFSVALRKAAPGLSWDAWLLVGAPRGNSSLPQHAELHQPGVVYQCRLRDDRRSTCTMLILDPTGNEKVFGATGLSYHHRKDDAWIGGSLDVEEGENGRVVTCGPRWINQLYDDSYLMNGICYYYDKGSMLSGEDARTRNRSEIVIGAPGVFDWKGSTIRYRDSRLGGYGDSTQYNELNVVNPEFVGSLPYLGYFGFSVGAGAFFPGNENTYYVAGAPRAAEYRGKVLLYDVPNSQIQSDISVLREFVGTQMGEYFGASICVVDLTGDGLPDLVIGAPGHSLLTVNSDRPQGDEGRIYVFINELISLTQGGFRELGEDSKIMGTQHYGARFGTTIVNIGDINLDGHE
ncbi:hypothetical protein B566_EDAN017983, partial [Ephemera danica]